MEQEKTVVGIYRFRSSKDYYEAKKEAEAIEYLKAKTDLSRGENALKLYNQLVAKGYFTTVVGQDFLRELRETAVSKGTIASNRLVPIVIDGKNPETSVPKKEKTVADLEKEVSTYRTLYEDLKGKRNSWKVVVIFLVLMLAGCVVITLMSDNTLITDYRTKIENEYSDWQEQLQEKEALLDEREKQLNRN